LGAAFLRLKGGDEVAEKMDEKQLVGYVNDLYNKGNQARWMYLNQWMQNYFFYTGNQYVRWVGNGEAGKWEVYPEVEGRIQYVNNKILPAVGMTVGRMIKDDMQQLVLHATNDEKSIDAAKAATRFLEYLWRVNDGDMMLLETCMWSVLTGIGITKIYVDLEKGPQRKDSKAKDGEICVDVISPFEFVVPPNARHMQKLPWAMHARMETKEYVYEKWGVEVEGHGQYADTWAMYQAVNLDIMGSGAFFGSNTQFSDDTVLVKELWIRPCKRYPKGRVIIIAGETVVHDDDIPWDKDYWPFNWLPFRNVPFRFWPMSMIEPMIDPQKAINKLSSAALENIQYMGNPVILAPRGSVDPDEIIAEPGAVWEYTETAGTPQFVTPNPVPTEVYNEIARQETHIYDLAGMHMLGSGMGGLRAAAAIMLVQQQDETAFAPIIENVKGFLKRDAELKLFLAQKAFSVPRKIKVLGEENQWMVQEFNAADLVGDEEIVIQAKQDLANDKATRFNQILQVINLKDDDGTSILDKQAKMRLLGDLGIEATNEYDLDFNRAKWENQKLIKGEHVAVNDFDDHAVHIKVHNQERKRIEFDSLPQEVKDAFALHVQDHEQMLQQQSPMQTEAKGDEMVQGDMSQEQSQQPDMAQEGLPQLPNMPGYDATAALQSGLNQVHNLIGHSG
jgi:hypothetical protein